MRRSCGCFNRLLERAILGLILLLADGVPAFAQARSESEVKALFFVTIARYTEWPASAFSADSSPIVIGVLGENPFGTLLESLTRNEQIRGRPLKIERYTRAAEIKTCHLLFVSEMSDVRLEVELKDLTGRTILTVSDQANFIRKGGMVEMYVNRERKVRLRASKSALEKAGLSLSPTLTRLAEIVASLEWVLPPPEQVWFKRPFSSKNMVALGLRGNVNSLP